MISFFIFKILNESQTIIIVNKVFLVVSYENLIRTKMSFIT